MAGAAARGAGICAWAFIARFNIHSPFIGAARKGAADVNSPAA